MNIVYVFLRPKKPEVYGGEKSMIITAQGAAARGHRVRCLVTARDDLVGELERAGLPYDVILGSDPFNALRHAGPRELVQRLWTLFRLNRRVFELAAGERPAVVHVSGVPAVATSWFGAKLARGSLVFHMRDTSRTGLTRWYEELCILAADSTVAISESLRERVIETASPALRPALSRRVVAVYNGFDFGAMDAFLAAVTRADARAALGVEEADVVAVSVGAVSEKKGQLRLIERVLPAAVARAPRLRLVFLGGVSDEAYSRRCRDAVARLGLEDHVRFTGYTKQEDTYRWFRASDLGVVGSAREGLSRFAVEAQAFGLPVVSTRVVGPVDVVDDGVTGFLIDEARLEDMAGPLAALAADPAQRARLGRAGAARVRERFVLERHHAEIARLYDKIAS